MRDGAFADSLPETLMPEHEYGIFGNSTTCPPGEYQLNGGAYKLGICHAR